MCILTFLALRKFIPLFIYEICETKDISSKGVVLTSLVYFLVVV